MPRLVPRFKFGFNLLSADLLNRIMDMLRWWETKEGFIQYKTAKHYEPARNARGGVLPVIIGAATPINGNDPETATQWDYEWQEAEASDQSTWEVKEGGQSSGGVVLPARNVAEFGNLPTPIVVGTVGVSNGVLVGVEVLSMATATTRLLPIREGRVAFLRYYAGRHWMDIGNDSDTSVVCNG